MTGCGKSTLINSLVFGTESLEALKIPEVVPINKNGKQATKIINKEVIDLK